MPDERYSGDRKVGIRQDELIRLSSNQQENWSPEDIKYQAIVRKIAHAFFPENFPRVDSYDQQSLTMAFVDGEAFYPKIDKTKRFKQKVAQIGISPDSIDTQGRNFKLRNDELVYIDDLLPQPYITMNKLKRDVSAGNQTMLVPDTTATAAVFDIDKLTQAHESNIGGIKDRLNKDEFRKMIDDYKQSLEGLPLITPQEIILLSKQRSSLD